jgi:predicted HAD superfamily Cof-like phosphohydrolase
MTEKTETRIYQIFEDYNNNTDTKISPENIQDLVDSICRVVDENSTLDKVKTFMNLFNQEILNVPTIPSDKIVDLRLSLALEEHIELATACGSRALSEFGILLKNKAEEIRNYVEKHRENLQPNLIEVFDALFDIEYIHKGTIHTFGGRYLFEEGFDLVHESNMSKICKNYEEALITQNNYSINDINTEILKQLNDTYICVRHSDSKVLKSINYKPVDLQQLIYGTTNKVEFNNEQGTTGTGE